MRYFYVLINTIGFLFAFTNSLNASELDRPALEHTYREGEFESLVKQILDFQKKNTTYSRKDSLFIARHLGVVYAANPATREKGKYYMHQILALNLEDNLVDLFVSDEILKTFDGVKNEFITARAASGKPLNEMDLDKIRGMTLQDPPNEKRAYGNYGGKIENEKDGNGIWWVTGGVAAASVIGVAAYVVMSSQENPSAKPEKVVVPVPIGR